MSDEIERADNSRHHSGLGPTSSGPTFAPPSSGLPREDRPLRRPTEAPAAHPAVPGRSLARRVGPVLGTLGVLVVAIVVIVAGTIADNRQAAKDLRRPAQVPSNSAPPAVASEPTGEPDAIEFTTRDGRGQLSVEEHTWLRRPGSTEARLRVLVELRALDGMIEYDPAYFFAAHDLSDPIRAEDSFAHGDLDIGLLEPGEAARGYLTFVLPRGEVTLMMSSNAADWVTAIKIGN